MKSGPRLPQLEKALAQKWRPNTAKNKQINNFLKKTKKKNYWVKQVNGIMEIVLLKNNGKLMENKLLPVL